MATDFSGIKLKLDLPTWQATPLIYNNLHVIQTGLAGSTLSGDKRASQHSRPNIYFQNSTTALYKYNTRLNGWVTLGTPALAGVFGIGACTVFAPSQGPRGTIAAGATTTTITLSTVLPVAVGQGQLVGQRIRVIGNNAGGSGLTAIRRITANTAGTTPLITVDSSFGFTPGSGAAYEILAGRLFMLGAGTTAAGIWKWFDESTTSYSGNLATTNLPATINTGSTILCMDELHTPITGPSGVTINGEEGGYYGELLATASAATTLTGQVTEGDSGVVANQWRNFQIRVIQDTVNPTAVGQRRRITSHTGGASPVYTVPAWTVTPSSSARYYIENNNDIILWTGVATSTYRYDITANAWDTTAYAVKPAANAAGTVCCQPFASRVNPGRIYNWRGGVTATLDVLDITAGATGAWTAAVPYDNQFATFNTSCAHAYSALDNKILISPVSLANAPTNFYVFLPDELSLTPYSPCPQVPSTVADGDRLAVDYYVDGLTKKAFFYWLPSNQTYMLRTLFYV